MEKLNLKSDRSFRVNLVSMLAGLMTFGLFLFLFVVIHYNLFGLFEETKSYTRTTFTGMLSIFAIVVYLLLNLLLTANSIFAEDDESRVIDGKLIRIYFKVDSKMYFNWDVYIICLFPVVILISILVIWIKSQYIRYIDD